MATDRKELLLSEGTREVNPKAGMEATTLEEGTAFAQMRNTYGWKLLMERYVAQKLERNRFLTANKEELGEVRAAMKELQDLVDIVERRINDALKISERRKNQ